MFLLVHPPSPSPTLDIIISGLYKLISMSYECPHDSQYRPIVILCFLVGIMAYIQSCSEYNYHLCLHFIIMLKYRASLCGMCVNLPFLPWLDQ